MDGPGFVFDVGVGARETWLNSSIHAQHSSASCQGHMSRIPRSSSNVGVEIGVNALGSAFLFSSVSMDTALYWDCLVPT